MQILSVGGLRQGWKRGRKRNSFVYRRAINTLSMFLVIPRYRLVLCGGRGVNNKFDRFTLRMNGMWKVRRNATSGGGLDASIAKVR